MATAMTSWRSKVANAVDQLGGSLTRELQSLRGEGLGFEKRVNDDTKGLGQEMRKAVNGITANLEATVQADGVRLHDHEKEFVAVQDGTLTLPEIPDAFNSLANDQADVDSRHYTAPQPTPIQWSQK